MTYKEAFMETPIFMHFGETVIPGVLNDTKAARELIKRLPCTIRASRYEFDICGVIDPPLAPYSGRAGHRMA